MEDNLCYQEKNKKIIKQQRNYKKRKRKIQMLQNIEDKDGKQRHCKAKQNKGKKNQLNK